MPLFKIFSNPQTDEIIEKMIGRIFIELPPALIDGKRKVLSVNKITRLLEATYAQIALYKKTAQIGVVRRALMANKFKWGLKNKGYPDDFIEVATEGLIVELSKKDAIK